jgi:hypothetical protein
MARCSEDRVQEDLFGCRNWLGPLNKDGYGKWGSELAHRHVYEIHHGTIPSGLWIDHTCSNRKCIEITHLEAVTPRENILRSFYTRASINARKTHCTHGHAFDSANTYYRLTGGRSCRACHRANGLKYRAHSGPFSKRKMKKRQPSKNMRRPSNDRPGGASAHIRRMAKD